MTASKRNAISDTVYASRKHRPRCHGHKSNALFTLQDLLSMGNMAEARNGELQKATSLESESLKRKIITYCSNRDHNFWNALCSKIRDDKYTPAPYRIHRIPKDEGNFREIYIRDNPEDRLVERMIYLRTAPVLEKTLSHSAYAYRENVSMAQMIGSIQQHRQMGYDRAIKVDVSKFFDTIDQAILKGELQKALHPEPEAAVLLSKFISSRYKDPVTGNICTMRRGVAQGGILAPLLANFYCNPMDQVMESVPGISYYRYADDILIISKDVQEAEYAYTVLKEELDKLHLSVNEKKFISGTLTGMDVLGIRFAENNSLSIHAVRLRKKLKEIYLEESPLKREQKWIGLLQHYNNIDGNILANQRILELIGEESSNWSITLKLQEILERHIR